MTASNIKHHGDIPMVSEVTGTRVLDSQISALSDMESNINQVATSMTSSPLPATPDTEEGLMTEETSSASNGGVSVKTSVTFGAQPQLPPLPIPSLEETLNKFLRHMEP